MTYAGLIFAVQAALCLVQCLLLGIAQRNLAEIMIADLGILHRHFVFLQ